MKRDPAAFQRHMLMQSFNQFDADGSGTLEPEEVKQAMALQGVDLSFEEVSQLFAEVDEDGAYA